MLVTLQRKLEVSCPTCPYATTPIARFESTPPFQRRVLAPLVAYDIASVTHVNLAKVEDAIRIGALFGSFAVLDQLAGPIAALTFAALVPIGAPWNPVIDSYPAALVLLCAAWLVERGRYAVLMPLTLVGAFIRESAALIPLLAFSPRWSTATGAAFLAAFLVVARLFPGEHGYWNIGFNVEHLTGSWLIALTTLGPLALGLAAAVRARGTARRMAIIGVGYGLAVLLVGAVTEPRVFFETYALIAPAIAKAVEEERG